MPCPKATRCVAPTMGETEKLEQLNDMCIPDAEETDGNYENFIAKCPHCEHKNIFNRVSDLEIVEPIDFKRVICFNSNCRKPFNIGGDSINENYEYLILDCYELLEIKRYMYCILNLCQACEMFFRRAIETKLLFQPYRDKVFEHTEQLNALFKKLYDNIEKYTFDKLRQVFFNLYFYNKSFQSIKMIEDYIDTLDHQKNIIPDDSEIEKYPNIKARNAFKELKCLGINKLRNNVVHKYGYRPSKQEVEENFKKIQGIICALDSYFKIGEKYQFSVDKMQSNQKK